MEQHRMRCQSKRSGWWIVAYGRLGYAAKAIVYIVVGLLALGTSIGVARRPPNTEGALTTISDRPYGLALLTLLTFGLFGYAVWQFVAAIVDGEQDGSDTKGRLARLGKGWGAIVYTMLALEAGQAVVSRLRGGEQTEVWIARVLRFPFGPWLVMLLGTGVVIYGAYQFYTVYAPPVRWHPDVACLGRRACLLVLSIGRFGLFARGVLFTLVGCRLVLAGFHVAPQEAAGLGETFVVLGQQTLGPVVLATVAAGFVSYGLFELFNAWFRQLDVPIGA